MFLLRKSPYDQVARATTKGAQEALEEGYKLVGECDETYKLTKALDKLPKETPKESTEEAPKAKAKAKERK